MNRVLFALLLAVLVITASAPVSAEVLTHEEGKVEITVPDTWKSKAEGDVLEITAPNEEMAVVFMMLPAEAADKAFEAIDKDLEKAVGPITWANEGKAAEEKINEMPASEWNGTAKEGKMSVDCLAIDTPAEKTLAIYWFATPDAEKKYDADVKTIVQGLKPMAAAAPAAAPADGADGADDDAE